MASRKLPFGNRRGRPKKGQERQVVDENFEVEDAPDESVERLARTLDDEDEDPEPEGWSGDCA